MLSTLATLVPLALAASDIKERLPSMSRSRRGSAGTSGLHLDYTNGREPLLKLDDQHVCGTNFDEHSARMACYELGFSRVKSWKNKGSTEPKFPYHVRKTTALKRCEVGGSGALKDCVYDPKPCHESDGAIILECEGTDPEVVELTAQIYGFWDEKECESSGLHLAPLAPLALDIEARCTKALPPVGQLKLTIEEDLLSLYESGSEYMALDVTFRIKAHSTRVAATMEQTFFMAEDTKKRLLNALQEGLSRTGHMLNPSAANKMQLTVMYLMGKTHTDLLSETWAPEPVESNEVTTEQKVIFYVSFAIGFLLQILVLYKCVNCCIDKKIREYDGRLAAKEDAEEVQTAHA